MPEDSFNEKRSATRFPVHIQADFDDPAFSGEIIPSETNDIGSDGLGLLTDKELLPGIELNIILRMRDNGEEFRLKGKVIWTSLTVTGKYRVGVKLEGPRLKPIPLVLRVLNSK